MSSRLFFKTANVELILSFDGLIQVMAAKIWTTWELTTAHLIPNEENIRKGADDNFALVCLLFVTAFLLRFISEKRI